MLIDRAFRVPPDPVGAAYTDSADAAQAATQQA
jgi:hypothetical protein